MVEDGRDAIPGEEPSRFQSMFGKRKRVREDMPKMNVKGQRQYDRSMTSPMVNPGTIERQLYAIDKGPRMLPRRQRFRVWMALMAIGGWFVSCFALVAYRLRSDDLELMEREVYEELKLKKEVKRFQERQKRIDTLSKPDVDGNGEEGPDAGASQLEATPK